MIAQILATYKTL